MDAKKQLNEWLKSIGCYCVYYIGYCADEEQRYEKRTLRNVHEVYPLVEYGICEYDIWEWAKKQPIFNNYYKTNKRCGCMYCPLTSKLNLAYLYKYYPENFAYMMEKVAETEVKRSEELGRPFAVLASEAKYNVEYMRRIIPEKWLPILNEKEKQSEGE